MISNITKYVGILFLNPVMNMWVKQDHWIQSHKINTQKQSFYNWIPKKVENYKQNFPIIKGYM